MEPINSEAPAEVVTNIAKNTDRITLGQAESQKVLAWVAQINLASRGFLSLSKSDIVNFILRQHKSELTPKEIQRLRSDNYDPVKHLNWIAPQIKRALTDNNFERVAELQHELRGVELSIVTSAMPPTAAAHNSSISPRKNRKLKRDTEKTETCEKHGESGSPPIFSIEFI